MGTDNARHCELINLCNTVDLPTNDSLTKPMSTLDLIEHFEIAEARLVLRTGLESIVPFASWGSFIRLDFIFIAVVSVIFTTRGAVYG